MGENSNQKPEIKTNKNIFTEEPYKNIKFQNPKGDTDNSKNGITKETLKLPQSDIKNRNQSPLDVSGNNTDYSDINQHTKQEFNFQNTQNLQGPMPLNSQPEQTYNYQLPVSSQITSNYPGQEDNNEGNRMRSGLRRNSNQLNMPENNNPYAQNMPENNNPYAQNMPENNNPYAQNNQNIINNPYAQNNIPIQMECNPQNYPQNMGYNPNDPNTQFQNNPNTQYQNNPNMINQNDPNALYNQNNMGMDPNIQNNNMGYNQGSNHSKKNSIKNMGSNNYNNQSNPINQYQPNPQMQMMPPNNPENNLQNPSNVYTNNQPGFVPMNNSQIPPENRQVEYINAGDGKPNNFTSISNHNSHNSNLRNMNNDNQIRVQAEQINNPPPEQNLMIENQRAPNSRNQPDQTDINNIKSFESWKQNQKKSYDSNNYLSNRSHQSYHSSKASGYDRITLDNGYVYEGGIKDGNFEGKGKYYQKSNPEIGYIGDWKNNLKNGKGTETFSDGSVYEGQFVDGKQNGKGKLTLSDGKIYQGDFENGNIKGEGIFHYSNESFYIGEWDNNFFNGYGCLCSKNKKFIGFFLNNKKNGLGFVYLYDSDSFILGRWRENKGENFYINGNEKAGVEVFYVEEGGRKNILTPEMYMNNQEFLSLKEFFYSNIKNSKFLDQNMKLNIKF
ncbi:MAG: hypothetical protein MJ252_05730 [archaeon]|nr:hypothetical protein [archaeon]